MTRQHRRRPERKPKNGPEHADKFTLADGTKIDLAAIPAGYGVCYACGLVKSYIDVTGKHWACQHDGDEAA